MALTHSTMLEVGTEAPDFSLLDTVSQTPLTLSDVVGEKGTLVFFICNHCPYVIHTIEELVRVADDYKDRQVTAFAVSSNDVDRYPLDSPDNMTAFAKSYNFTFPYLYDETQSVARAYDAACTPDIYLFDAEQKLYYRGRLDANRPGSGTEPNGADLRAAIDALLAGKPSPQKQYPSAGCGIKWKG